MSSLAVYNLNNLQDLILARIYLEAVRGALCVVTCDVLQSPNLVAFAGQGRVCVEVSSPVHLLLHLCHWPRTSDSWTNRWWLFSFFFSLFVLPLLFFGFWNFARTFDSCIRKWLDD